MVLDSVATPSYMRLLASIKRKLGVETPARFIGLACRSAWI